LSIFNVLLVGVGGMLGSVARYLAQGAALDNVAYAFLYIGGSVLAGLGACVAGLLVTR
jgi:fluoride ion exporter CrcB/FEX